MAKYGNFVYGGAVYGTAPKLAYSVEPMSLTILNFTKTRITWNPPTGAFTKIKLIRNQLGFSETSEDGVIIWEENATEGTVTRNYFTDGEDNPTQIPLVPGRQVYYSMFLFTDQKVWVNAGKIADLVPSNHGVHKKIMDLIPKVYTSNIQSPLGVTDESSDIYKFMEGISFTHEQFLSQLDVLRPQHSEEGTPYTTLNYAQYNVGLIPEPGLPVKNQKRLIREAIYMYTHKGLKGGIETYAESLTGFAPTVTVSENLLLSPQDSTFYNGLGNWVFGNATATSSNEQVPASGNTVIDNVYSCKLVAPSNSFSMILGEDDPIKKGIPVNAGVEYTVSCKIKSPSSDGNVYISLAWFDGTGTYIDSTSQVNTSANNTWKLLSQTATTPANAVYAGIDISSSAAGTYYVDQVCMQVGDTVAYDEARAITVFLFPTKTNLIKNPSFEVNVTDDWTLAGTATASRVTDVSAETFTGTHSAKITATGNWTFTSSSFPIERGVYYTFSGLTKTTADLSVSFVGRDLDGNIVENIDVYDLGTITDWSKFSATDLTDALNLTVATYEVVLSGGSGSFYFDSLIFEKNFKASEYFDGALPSEYGTVWGGTPNNSYSYLYPNKPLKIPRLGKTLPDWVPPNSFWRLTTYAGVEYTNLTV